MDRVAVFVDAGYVFAAGSMVLLGEKLPRGQLRLDARASADFFERFAQDLSGLPLLRIYWYDGTSSGPSLEHKALADTDNVKVRLGLVNQQGEQKGVDSLIITDMINLARNRAMATAVLITGDEDIRVGVQQAQEFGVRVHLVGIRAEGEFNQSMLLCHEADLRRELSEEELRQFLSVRAPTTVATVEPDDGTGAQSLEARVALAVWAELDAEQQGQVKAALARGERQIPGEIDRTLLKTMTSQLGRELVFGDKVKMRDAFKKVATEG